MLSLGENCFGKRNCCRLKGELLLGQSGESVQEAEQCLCEALKIAQDQHATMLELRAATSLAKLWRKLNKVDDAKRILNAVYSRFNERVDNLDLIEAKTVLEQLIGYYVNPSKKVKLAQSQTISRKQPAIRPCRDDYSITGKTVAISIASIGYDGRLHFN